MHSEKQNGRQDEEAPKLVFNCNACGRTLAVNPGLAGTSGPCPLCGAWITSPEPVDGGGSGSVRIPPPVRTRGTRVERRKGRIPADAIVDQKHLEQREASRSLKVLAMFVLAACACLAIAWLLQLLMAK